MNTVWIVMPILLVLMFLLGTDLNRQAFANVARNPKAVLAGMVGQLVLLPLIVFGIAWVLDLPPVYFMGLVLVACCPGGSSSNVFSMLAKGDVA
ncbi:MAG: bile acid:sodium symporter, partial [Bacteroidales bacterium]|nr:bile acid:sodium symporter [Bacteroidales bacterium]